MKAVLKFGWLSFLNPPVPTQDSNVLEAPLKFNVSRGFANSEQVELEDLTKTIMKKIRPLLDSKRLVSYKVQGYQLDKIEDLHLLESKLETYLNNKDIDVPLKLSVTVVYQDTQIKTRSVRGDVFITPL